MALARLLLFTALLFLSGCVQESEIVQVEQVEKAVVAGIIDGDTLTLQGGEKIRLIGIDAREKGEQCFEEAKQGLEDLVSGKEVFLEKDVNERDKYGRLVRYVFLDGKLVNLAMVEQGLAFAFEFEPDNSKAQLFKEAELRAMEGNGCLWRK